MAPVVNEPKKKHADKEKDNDKKKKPKRARSPWSALFGGGNAKNTEDDKQKMDTMGRVEEVKKKPKKDKHHKKNKKEKSKKDKCVQPDVKDAAKSPDKKDKTEEPKPSSKREKEPKKRETEPGSGVKGSEKSTKKREAAPGSGPKGSGELAPLSKSKSNKEAKAKNKVGSALQSKPAHAKADAAAAKKGSGEKPKSKSKSSKVDKKKTAVPEKTDRKFVDVSSKEKQQKSGGDKHGFAEPTKKKKDPFEAATKKKESEEPVEKKMGPKEMVGSASSKKHDSDAVNDSLLGRYPFAPAVATAVTPDVMSPPPTPRKPRKQSKSKTPSVSDLDSPPKESKPTPVAEIKTAEYIKNPSKTPLKKTSLLRPPAKKLSAKAPLLNVDEVLRIGSVLERHGMDPERRQAFEWLAEHRSGNERPVAISFHLMVALGDIRLDDKLTSGVLNRLIDDGIIGQRDYERHFAQLENLPSDKRVTVGHLARLINTHCRDTGSGSAELIQDACPSC